MKALAELIPDRRKANKAEVAEFFSISMPVLEKWIREGMPVIQKGGRGIGWVIDLRAVAEWRYTARLASGQIDPETLPPGERKQWYDGEAKRIDLAVSARELIRASELEEEIATAYASIAQTMLSLPDWLERRAGISPEQAEECEAVIHEAMTGLSDRLQTYATIEGDG
jgi:terminase small subunit / prophage DNA-packing protein